MQETILFIFDFYNNLFNKLNSYHWDIVGLNITLFDIIIGAVATSMIISVFWKGARG